MAAGSLAVLIGGGHLVAWLSGALTRFAAVSNTIVMTTNAGVGVLSCGVALVLLAVPQPAAPRRSLARALAALALLVGAATLSEHVVGWNLGIDQLIAIEQAGAAGITSPNRMGPPASVSLALLGVALLFLSRAPGAARRRAHHEPFALVVALLGLLAIIGYLYGVSALYNIAQYTGIAWPTAFSFVVLAVGVLCVETDTGLMARVTADDPGGAIVRALLGPMVLLPLALGWVRLTGERHGWFDPPMGTGLMMLLFIIIFSSLLLFAGRRVSLSSAALLESEQTARRQKDLLAVTLASIGDGVIVTDAAGTVTFVNGEAERLTGWTDAEARGQALPEIFAIVNEETRRTVENPVARVLRDGEVVGLANHTVLLARDGRENPIDDSAAPIRQSGGDVQGVVLVFRDITERKRSEEALHRERTLLASVMSATDVMLVYLDCEFNFVWVNAAYAGACGMRPEEIVGRNHFDLYPHAENEAIFRRVRDTGEAVFYKDKPFEFPDQPERGVTYWDWSLVPSKDASGRVTGLVFSLRDTTKSKRDEIAARESERQYRDLFENMTEEVQFWRLVRDDHGEIVTWRLEDANRPALRTWGRTLDEIKGRTTDEIFGPGSTEHYMPVVRKIFAEGAPCSFTDYFPQLHKHFRFTTIPIGDHFITTGSDISEIVQVNEALREEDRRKNEFLALLSHELRNPLAAVRSAIYVLGHSEAGGEQANRATAVIDRQAAQLSRLVDDLLDVTRIARGKTQVQKEPLEFAGLVRRTAEDHRALFANRGIDLDVDIPDGPLWVNGDAQRLAQAVGNLLHNAAKFTDRGGRTGLAVRTDEGGAALVTVRDTGVGISLEALPRLFEPFVQVDSTIDRARGGLGLGLALVKSLVEMHDGSVTAHSDGAGRGATFSIRLPLDAAALPARPIAPTGSGHRRRRVLIIEDNVDAADSLREALALAGHYVEVARDGAEGIEKARQWAPEIVLCDIGLPGMDGYEVAQALRSDPKLASMSLVALTGYALPEDVAKAREAGFDLHVAKPPTPEKLQEALGALGRASRVASR